jgi:hypothetical protein
LFVSARERPGFFNISNRWRAICPARFLEEENNDLEISSSDKSER